jgi:hypothetical protein
MGDLREGMVGSDQPGYKAHYSTGDALEARALSGMPISVRIPSER